MATKWGIVGPGKISHDFVAALHSLSSSEHKIVAVASRNKQKAAEFAKIFNIERAYGSYEDFVKDPDIDICYVGVINPYHFSVSKFLLEHGKNVLCEKPMCMNLADTEKLISIAREKDLFLMEAVWSRFIPVYDVLRSELQKGTIGEVRNVNITLGIKNYEMPRISCRELGGGGMLDIGVYTLQLITLVLGSKMPTEIQAVGVLNDENVDECASYILKFDNKQLATASISSSYFMENKAYITGTKGYIEVCAPFWKGTKISVNGEVKEIPFPPSKYTFNIPNAVALCYEADYVRKCLKQGLTECPLLTHHDSLILAQLEEFINKQIGRM